MSAYLDEIAKVHTQIQGKDEWHAINPEYAVRMKLQNRFKTGLESFVQPAPRFKQPAQLQNGIHKIHVKLYGLSITFLGLARLAERLQGGAKIAHCHCVLRLH